MSWKRKQHKAKRTDRDFQNRIKKTDKKKKWNRTPIIEQPRIEEQEPQADDRKAA